MERSASISCYMLEQVLKIISSKGHTNKSIENKSVLEAQYS